jgi:hypothetical protein
MIFAQLVTIVKTTYQYIPAKRKGDDRLAAIQATWTANRGSIYSSRNSCNRQHCIDDSSQTLSGNKTSSDSEAVHLVVVEEPAMPMELSPRKMRAILTFYARRMRW